MATVSRILAAVLLFAVTSNVYADITYRFFADSNFDNSFTGSAVYTAPDYISSNIIVAPADLDFCSITMAVGVDSCNSIRFWTDTSSLHSSGLDSDDAIGFGMLSSRSTFWYYFPNGALATLGSFSTILFGAEQAGRLIVSDASSVPEPSTLLLVALGFLGLTLTTRRKPTWQ